MSRFAFEVALVAARDVEDLVAYGSLREFALVLLDRTAPCATKR